MLDFAQGVEKVKKHMKLAFNIEDFNITMAEIGRKPEEELLVVGFHDVVP